MMYFCSFTLQDPQHIIDATAGNFTGTGDDDEIVVNQGTQISLFRQIKTPHGDEIFKILTKQTFSHIFSVKTLSFPESTHDFLVITSDSGNITIVDLKGEKFTKLICIPFARTGMRRFEPGYYLSVSPCGRSIFTASLEKYKVGWQITQTETFMPVLGQTVETTRSHSTVHFLTALDVGYESPMFALIERVFKPDKTQQEPVFDPQSEPKLLVFYEVNPSILSIVRRRECGIMPSSTHLVAVPGPLYGCPGGVIVCSAGTAQYFSTQSDEVQLIPLPSRKNSDVSIILKSATFSAQGEDGGTWFAFMQNQYGDILTATSKEPTKDDPSTISIQYLDTVPLAKSLIILRQGVLCVFGENCENRFYNISGFEGTTPELEYEPLSLEDEDHKLELFFSQPLMNNLVKMAIVPSAFGGRSGDLITLHGKGENSCLKYTRRGIPIDEIYKAKLGGNNSAIHVVKRSPADEFDSYAFITMVNQTKILMITPEGQITDQFDKSAFVVDSETLDVFQFADSRSFSTIQIHRKGLRVVAVDGVTTKNWTRDGHPGFIAASTWNLSQIAIAYDDGVITLFESNEHCIPTERSSIHIDDVEGHIIALAIPQPPEGIRLAKWLAIATDRMRIYVVSLGGNTEEDETKFWKISGRQIVSDPVHSLQFLYVVGVGHVLHIGFENGTMQTLTLNDNDGTIGSTNIRFLGPAPVTFSKINLKGHCQCLLANAGSPHLIVGLSISQFAAPTFETICQVYASFCPDGGYIGITNESDLLIYEITDIHSSMQSTTLPLPMTPRIIIPIEGTTTVFIACSDLDNQAWRTSFLIYDYSSHEIVEILDGGYEPGYCATSGAYLPFANLICLGLAHNLRFNPRTSNGGRILLIDPNDFSIHHVTDVEDIPGAIGIFNESIICGIGDIIRIYTIGTKVLLKFCESRTMPYFISFISAKGHRIVVGDAAESYHFLKFDKANSIITPFCDDCVPRFPLSSALLDHSTVASGDRFGNFTVLRVPADVSDEAEVDLSGVGMVWEHPEFVGAANKFDLAASFHIGDPITALQLSQSKDVLIYSTIGGAIGAMVPLLNDNEASVVKRVEREMRIREQTLTGRNHELFRSYYTPLTNVADGDLVKKYMELPDKEQREIADKLNCLPVDISSRIVSIESRV